MSGHAQGDVAEITTGIAKRKLIPSEWTTNQSGVRANRRRRRGTRDSERSIQTISVITHTIPGVPEPPLRIDVDLASSPELANLASIFGDLVISSMSANQLLCIIPVGTFSAGHYFSCKRDF